MKTLKQLFLQVFVEDMRKRHAIQKLIFMAC